MRFAYPLPAWALVALFGAAVALALTAYARARAALGPGRHAVLASLRTVTLCALIVFLLRPVMPVQSEETGAAVAIVIDTSRSMNLRDGGAETRLARAVRLVSDRLMPALGRSFEVELFAGEQAIEVEDLPRVAANGLGTNLRRTIRSIAHRYSQDGPAGVVLISDGAETQPDGAADDGFVDQPPVVAIGIGAASFFDREVRSVTVGPSVLDGSLVDLTVTAVTHRDRERALRLKLYENARLVDLQQIESPSDGAPVQHVFTVAPSRSAASIFRVEIEGNPDELTLDNNRIDVLVPPPGRRRRILMLEGAPGFEHAFLKRSWLQDTSLELDSVVRKGQNERGEDTYYVQAAAARSAALSNGFPETREALLTYDAVVLANIDLETLSQAQLEWLADFVGERGGGLLALGTRTLRSAGLPGSALARVMPIDLSDRGSDAARASAAIDVERFKVGLTPDGLRHPVMRLAQSNEETMKRWAALPALAGVQPVGAPRPGGAVLAWTASGSGRALPLVAVQRFGRGRSMVFSGEASWRWKMMRPSADRSYDTFWRQAIRWLSVQAPDPLSIAAPGGVPVGDGVPLTIHVRDAAFRPAVAPVVEATITGPDGVVTPASVIPVDVQEGRFTTVLPAVQPGLYRVKVNARQGTTPLGQAEHLVLAGGYDPELADPRLNEPVLRRLAEASGGRYLPAEEAASAPAWLREAVSARREELRDVWHGAWSFLTVVGLLCLEWTLRRRWGLR
ncbi:MAG TPA: glutamine amidotransferase [Vicinamibacterales bacterium]|nr:glutamine amidotransferase [Vicinamibacterales bacterium]